MHRFQASKAALVAAVVVVGETALADTLNDNFNNNSINTNLWDKDRVGGANVTETNHRLQVSANGNTNQRSYAYLEATDWGIDWSENFTLTLEYKLQLPAPPGERLAAVGVAFSFEEIPNNFNNFNGLTIGIQRESDGLWLVWYLYESGDIVSFDKKHISDTHDDLEIRWIRSQDRLKIQAAGKTLNLYGLDAAYGDEYGNVPLQVAVGGLTANGDVGFSGTNAWLDDFKLVGEIVDQ